MGKTIFLVKFDSDFQGMKKISENVILFRRRNEMFGKSFRRMRPVVQWKP
jgi:hypothetical protein